MFLYVQRCKNGITSKDLCVFVSNPMENIKTFSYHLLLWKVQ